MSISVKDARRTLAKVGIELGPMRRKSANGGVEARFQITTPVGTRSEWGSDEVLCLIAELRRHSVR